MKQSVNLTKTKIIGTIGPASNSVPVLEKMIEAGLDIVRLNFSHGDHEFHAQAVENVQAAVASTGRPVAILADLCGPKIRLGDLEADIPVTAGDDLVITTEKFVGVPGRVPTAYKRLAEDVNPGDTILIDDGLIRLEVRSTSGSDVHCKVKNSGVLKSRKGINLPGVKVSASSISEKDKNDLEFIISQPIDFVALSFVRSRDDIKELRWLLKDRGKLLPIIAKIEKPEAVADIDGIVAEADVIMVARGDLGVEMPTQDVPLLQKMIIEKCNMHNTPVITATQMLESMITNPRPTRAEASDVANAVFDGTDAVMLSAETSVGISPVDSVGIMDQIVSAAESRPELLKKSSFLKKDHVLSDAENICRAACIMAEEAHASAIIAITKRGRTARMLSKYRISLPIIAFTETEETLRYMKILWGVQGEIMDNVGETDATLQKARKLALDLGHVKRGDKVVYVAGIPLIESPSANMLKTETV
ncbi:pyruvate kinase [Marispirochaeta aestuarii]|uniref:Pyruvate kinase n=1 Tax=Marispirochaeta aestuarii TaxID=1963862 RepID=A0A1Y1RVN6_9SPIO|nr:pyruvate kinase [Marispirochaeta aestuarii]ORC34114.1 pyruvate kinase [Marispirochaeta aestuarii]